MNTLISSKLKELEQQSAQLFALLPLGMLVERDLFAASAEVQPLSAFESSAAQAFGVDHPTETPVKQLYAGLYPLGEHNASAILNGTSSPLADVTMGGPAEYDGTTQIKATQALTQSSSDVSNTVKALKLGLPAFESLESPNQSALGSVAPSPVEVFNSVQVETDKAVRLLGQTLYVDFREGTYSFYHSLESNGKSIGEIIDQGLTATGIPGADTLADPFLEFQYVDTASALPSSITSQVRNSVIDINESRRAFAGHLLETLQ